jgi:hypothetical protein
MAAWVGCLYDAADALYAQPEPANVIARAVFSACSAEELAWVRDERATRGTTYTVLADFKSDTVTGMVLERVMVARAAKAKAQGRAPAGQTPRYRPT